MTQCHNFIWLSINHTYMAWSFDKSCYWKVDKQEQVYSVLLRSAYSLFTQTNYLCIYRPLEVKQQQRCVGWLEAESHPYPLLALFKLLVSGWLWWSSDLYSYTAKTVLQWNTVEDHVTLKKNRASFKHTRFNSTYWQKWKVVEGGLCNPES